MRALVIDHSVPAQVRLGEVPEPEPGPGQALIEVKATSLNYGELSMAAGAEEGTVHGWEAAGVVREPAADGSGPAKGSRVVGGGGWAELRAVDTAELAVVPDAVELGAASTLPVAGATALRALRRLGFIAGERVLVTGASGGVGRFAVQIAALAGAHVIASVGSPQRGEGLAELGAAEVVAGPDGLDSLSQPLHGVIDNVGGPMLVRAFELLREGGSVQSIGGTSGEPAVFPPYATVGTYRRIEAFNNELDHLGTDLGYLLRWLAEGRLDPQIGWRGPWDRVAEAVELLQGRRLAGKAVLDIT